MTDHALMARAAAVWRALSLAFPSFVAVYGEDPAPIWIEKIATLTNEQCRAGVTELGKRADKSFPPNLTEFEKACGGGAAPAAQGQGRYRPPPPSAPTARPEVRARHLASIRAKLGMPQ